MLKSHINNDQYLCSTYCIPGTVLSALHMLTHLVHTATLRNRCILQVKDPDIERFSSLPKVTQLTCGAVGVLEFKPRQDASEVPLEVLFKSMDSGARQPELESHLFCLDSPPGKWA